ncbi:MAG: hypothetical protein VB119_12730 [Candidatus Metalachnospira sp.]|nr:hypothetical protein [Candidatus Metalachnospira sp.]
MTANAQAGFKKYNVGLFWDFCLSNAICRWDNEEKAIERKQAMKETGL